METFSPLVNLIVLLTTLSLAAERVTNVLKLRRPRLSVKGEGPAEEKERERRITQLAIVVSILVALLMKADLFANLGHLEAPWDTLGWAQGRGGRLVRSAALSGVPEALHAFGGSILTGFALGFGSKFWHDMLDIVFNARESLRRLAGSEET